MVKIISFHYPSIHIDVNTYFLQYKYAIKEHEPIKLSNGMYLHSYRVTKYNSTPAFEDEDVEYEAFQREAYH